VARRSSWLTARTAASGAVAPLLPFLRATAMVKFEVRVSLPAYLSAFDVTGRAHTLEFVLWLLRRMLVVCIYRVRGGTEVSFHE
jgi:hypothetical protein